MKTKTVTKCGLFVSALFLLSACAGPAQTTLADGSVAYQIDCDGSLAGLNRCFERAGKSCGAEGYMLVAQDGRVVSSSAAAGIGSEELVKGYEDDMNSIYFKCGS